MSHKFRGTGVALVTPFNTDNSIDFASLGKLVNHVIANKVDYLVALGTTAETPTLSADEKKNILAFIIAQNAGRVPVVCGIGGNNTAEVLQQIKNDDLKGVDGILSVVPYYSKPTQEGIYRHFKAIAEATDKPIILYNVPGRTACNMLASTALRLAKEHSNIIAIKEASGNMAQCMELVQGKPDHFAVLSGDDDLIVAQIAIGMEGVISVAANCFPADFTSMVNHALNNDYSAAQKLLYKLLPGIGLLFTEGNPPGVKAALKQLNIGQNILRLPVVPVSDETFNKISAFTANL